MTAQNDDDLRHARRSYYIGQAWLAMWRQEGRGTSGTAGIWITVIKNQEEKIYKWIWEEPALSWQDDEELDRYRAHQGGVALLKKFVEVIYATANDWFERARVQAETGDEGWLFSTESLAADGWSQQSGKTSAGATVTGWKKS